MGKLDILSQAICRGDDMEHLHFCGERESTLTYLNLNSRAVQNFNYLIKGFILRCLKN